MQKLTQHPMIRGGFMLVALALIAVSINFFYAPHGVAAGGATGIAILTQEAFGVPLGLTTLIVNVFMLVLAWVFLDRATTKRILIGSLLLPAMLAVMPQVKIVEDRLLAVIVGSVIFAVGVAINYRIDASSGGTTVPPMLMQKYFHIKPAIGLFVVDFVVCFFNIFVSGIEAFVLAIFAIGLTGLVMNYVETGLDRKKAVYVMTPEIDAMKEMLDETPEHGLTVQPVVGGHSGKTGEMLMVVVDQQNFHATVERIRAIDSNAFILAVEATEVHGGWLR